MTCADALELGQTWARLGVPAFPLALRWDNGKRGVDKRPLTPNGFYDGTTDPAALEQLFNARSPRPGEVWGVGLWPGPADRVVLDVDVKDGQAGDDMHAALAAEHGAWPDTPRVLSPSGGWHDWFIKPRRRVHRQRWPRRGDRGAR
jgi:hypothetical protein